MIQRFVLVCFACGFPIGLAHPSHGQDPGHERSLPVKEFGEPPADLAKLIRDAEVTFVTGGRPQSNPSTLSAGDRLSGETRFKLFYRYNGRVQWRPIPSSGGNRIEVKFRLSSLKVTSRHQIWLRRPPASEDFWQDPLVQHEFDHVRVSSHPAVANLFKKEARSLQRFEVSLRDVADGRGRVSRECVDAVVQKKLNESLEGITEYVRIRYRELDRQTRHGLLPRPESFSLKVMPDGQP
ncbi:MAG: hypothetical protein AAFV88_14590 [Planctomycetota bacterium]